MYLQEATNFRKQLSDAHAGSRGALELLLVEAALRDCVIVFHLPSASSDSSSSDKQALLLPSAQRYPMPAQAIKMSR